MASKIEWTSSTWNPIVGCSVVSPGCKHCYAMRMAARLGRMGQERYAGLTRPSAAGAVWTGEMRFVEETLTLPLRRRTPTTWFVNSMSDLFHEGVPDEWIDKVFAVMALAPQHTFQVLTKRSARMREYGSDSTTADRVWKVARDQAIGDPFLGPWFYQGRTTRWPGPSPWPLRNVWLGISAEDQQRADERVPDLLATPAAVRFVSAEPLLGPIEFYQSWLCHGYLSTPDKPLDLIIAGGESGPGARPMQAAWARSIRDQCAAAGVAFFFKQWGEWAPRDSCPQVWADGRMGLRADVFHVRSPEGDGRDDLHRVGKKAAGRLLDGRLHDALPEARHAAMG